MTVIVLGHRKVSWPASIVPGTDGLFAVHREVLEGQEGLKPGLDWIISHVPSGFGFQRRFSTLLEAMTVAAELYRRCEHGADLKSDSADLVLRCFPNDLRRWFRDDVLGIGADRE